MKKIILAIGIILILAACGDDQGPNVPSAMPKTLRLQLNWFHDPTFSGEYVAAKKLGGKLDIVEGGININPVQRLKSGLADVAIVGIDIALRAIDSDLQNGGVTDLRIVFADFQRNPVGWIVHPDVASRLGFKSDFSGVEKNSWLFDQFEKGTIQPGDKLGTETTAVWVKWSSVHQLTGVKPIQVGFDPSIMLDAPKLAFPVYLNEEPLKLSEIIGKEVAVFDPIDDGVELYGNVVLTTTSLIEKHPDELRSLLEALRSSWVWVRDNADATVDVVFDYYDSVSKSVLREQIVRTVELVFFNTKEPGVFDLTPTGRLSQTIDALIEVGSVSDAIEYQTVLPLVIQGSAGN